MRKPLEIFCVCLLGALVLLPFLQIVMRYVFNSPIVGAEELTRFILICTVFVSYPLVVLGGENIGMGEIRTLLSARADKWLDLVIAILSLAACGLIAVVTAVSISDNLNNATPTLKIPFWIFLGANFLGFAGAAIVHLLNLVRPPTVRAAAESET